MKHFNLLLNLIWYTLVVVFLAYNPLQLHWLILAFIVLINSLFFMVHYSFIVNTSKLDYILKGLDVNKQDV